jgi:OOP family OmpA-OmpF porin
MHNKLMLSSAALVLSLTVSASAEAADNGFYLGGSIGRSNVEIDKDIARIDEDDTAYKIIAGFRPLDFLGVEASYVNFGKPEKGTQKADSDGISAFVVGFLAVGPVDVYAKGGLINADTSVVTAGRKVFSEKGTEFAYGVGAQFRLLSLSFRAEYERFDIADDLNLLSVGVTYTFL